MFSDGMGDNFTNNEFGEMFVGKSSIKQVLLQIINEIYTKENEKITRGENDPNYYIKNNREFSSVLKGSSDNISGVIIDGGEERGK